MFNVDTEDKQLELVNTTSVTAKKQKQYLQNFKCLNYRVFLYRSKQKLAIDFKQQSESPN